MIFSPIVLNSGAGSEEGDSDFLDIRLTLALAELRNKFIDPERGVIDYLAIRTTEAYDSYVNLARRLRSFDLRSLKSRQRQLSFWINIYNAAVIHGVIALGITRSVKDFFKFFHRVSYEIGGDRFSLNDVEHGILRGNQRPPYGLFKPFGKKDHRKRFAILPMDPRIHFALVCGAASCPPVSFYEADQIDFQLRLAAESFINSPRVKVVVEKNLLLISMIFKWYKSDFGGSDQAVVETILDYLDEGEKKNYLREHRESIRITYQPYDWNLNQS